MEIVGFKEFLSHSTSKSFIALCSDGREWVIRCKKKDKDSKRLFSEYVAGMLAKEFGINHPETRIVRIPESIFEELNRYENVFDENCPYGVATLYIENLTTVKPPNVTSYFGSEFRRINVNHISKELSHVRNFEQLYALKVFSHWIFLSDYHKYENLKITIDKDIMFLDFDLSFESNEGSWGYLPEYSFIKVNTNQAPFWEGFTNELDPFKSWLNVLERLTQDECKSKLGILPNCWCVPETYLSDLFDYLFNNRAIFVTEFIHGIEFHKETNSSEE